MRTLVPKAASTIFRQNSFGHVFITKKIILSKNSHYTRLLAILGHFFKILSFEILSQNSHFTRPLAIFRQKRQKDKSVSTVATGIKTRQNIWNGPALKATRHTSHITSTASGLGSVGLAVSGPGYVVGAANGAGGVTSLPGVFLGLLLVVQVLMRFGWLRHLQPPGKPSKQEL